MTADSIFDTGRVLIFSVDKNYSLFPYSYADVSCAIWIVCLFLIFHSLTLESNEGRKTNIRQNNFRTLSCSGALSKWFWYNSIFITQSYTGLINDVFKTCGPTQWSPRPVFYLTAVVSSLYDRVSRSSPSFRPKCHAQELVQPFFFPVQVILRGYNFLQTCFLLGDCFLCTLYVAAFLDKGGRLELVHTIPHV